jgi:hypothetical protein
VVGSHVFSCPEQGETDGWLLWILQQCQPGKTKKSQDELIPAILEPDESSRESRKNWARLIRKIYEGDLLTCLKCLGQMHVISFIEDQDVIKKSLNHLGLWQVEPGPPPRIRKAQPTYIEAWIDYSKSQDAPSDRGPYHLTLI